MTAKRTHQNHDLPIGDIEVSSEDRIRLARYLQDHSPRSQSPAEIITLRISDSDINKLMSWALPLGGEGRAAYIDFNADWFRLALSLETPYRKSVFINVIAEGRRVYWHSCYSRNVHQLDATRYI